jgi:hypothetical protein
MGTRNVQLTFEGIDWRQPKPATLAAGASIADQFTAFHDDNPHVYDALVSLARQLQSRGFTRIGMRALFERLRWEYALETDGDVWCLNNSFTGCYARLLTQQEPGLAGLFELRPPLGSEPPSERGGKDE